MNTLEIEAGYKNINSLYEHIVNKQLIIPNYQREFCWDNEKIELLIDSVINNIPIGVFQFRKKYIGYKEVFEVVDGLHRLRVLMNVLNGNGIYFDEQNNTFSINPNHFDYSVFLKKNKLTSLFGSEEEYSNIINLYNTYLKFSNIKLLHFTYKGSDEDIKIAFERINQKGVQFSPVFNKVKSESIFEF